MTDKVRPSREAILAARKTVTVECPEIGQNIILRELSIGQMRNLKTDDVAAQLSMMIVDDKGNLLFDDEEGIQILTELSAAVSMRLITAAARLNGIGQSAVDEVVKNLLASPTSASASDSQ